MVTTKISAALILTVLICLYGPYAAAQTGSPSAIGGVQGIGGRSAIVYSGDAIFNTVDNGAIWTRLPLGVGPSEHLAGVYFENEMRGMALIAGKAASPLVLARTDDRGATWSRSVVDLRPDDIAEADFGDIEIDVNGGRTTLSFCLTSSSNFVRHALYTSNDGGSTWNFESTSSRLNKLESVDDPDLARLASTAKLPAGESVTNSILVGGSRWLVTQSGTCFGTKSACIQETRVRLADGTDVTPQQLTELALVERENASRTVTPTFSLPPGGTTRTSLNRGFDKCQAGSVAQMQLWWDNSPLYDSNIYFSGRNRACPSQPLNTTWINQVTAMGWGLIPTVVGYQSPCTASTTTVKLSYDPVMAETQGRGEADIAVTDATNIGLTTGSVIYYDMERYDPPAPDSLGCRSATVAFLKGWTERVRQLGYKSGVYGSPKNAQEDWANMPASSKMDAIWMARWDNITSVWTYLTFPTFPTTEWSTHQRIKQWQAPHNETWAGVTFNIDGNIADGPVAGVAILKNRNADFDGDGRSDVSIFRPSEGIWYVLSSINQTFKGVGFGAVGDVIAPGDYDGDGKTDYCVFRPADGVWHMLNKSGAYSARQFGASGDIPVPADYNGDGKTDLAVFRPSNGVWYIANSDSLGTYNFIQFGAAGDKPAPGDYDGDGRTDMAVFRPADGTWYVLRSSDNGFYGVGFGISTDLPAQGDYDGDGKTDIVVFRDGTWFLLQSTGGFSAMQFGQAGDIPASGDFDGDGKTDIAVFRSSDGTWYEMRSSTGFWATGFGRDGDRPVESAYLPR